jgi:hypothetical protein
MMSIREYYRNAPLEYFGFGYIVFRDFLVHKSVRKNY